MPLHIALLHKKRINVIKLKQFASNINVHVFEELVKAYYELTYIKYDVSMLYDDPFEYIYMFNFIRNVDDHKITYDMNRYYIMLIEFCKNIEIQGKIGDEYDNEVNRYTTVGSKQPISYSIRI